MLRICVGGPASHGGACSSAPCADCPGEVGSECAKQDVLATDDAPHVGFCVLAIAVHIPRKLLLLGARLEPRCVWVGVEGVFKICVVPRVSEKAGLPNSSANNVSTP